MSKSQHSIGALAEAGGCKVQTVRYYEEIGLLPRPARTRGNHRVYGQMHMDRLVFIRHGRKLGFSLESIGELLSLVDDPTQSCDSADRIAKNHLQKVETQIARLESLRAELTHIIEQCGGGQIDSCRIIEALATSLDQAHPPHKCA